MNALSALLIAATMTVVAGSAVNADIVYLNKIVDILGGALTMLHNCWRFQNLDNSRLSCMPLETSVAPLALYLGLVTAWFSKETVPRTLATTKWTR
jgi:hypothetical protein